MNLRKLTLTKNSQKYLTNISQKFFDFKPWYYPENFGIYSQLERKSKTWFFTSLTVYVSWVERDFYSSIFCET